jgi:hypothetical protein
VGRRGRRRGQEGPAAATSDYRDAEGNTLTLRGSLPARTRRRYDGLRRGSPLSREDAWQRATEFLFERLAVRWEISGLPIESQSELVGRYRLASSDERRFVREALREHVNKHFPELEAP